LKCYYRQIYIGGTGKKLEDLVQRLGKKKQVLKMLSKVRTVGWVRLPEAGGGGIKLPRTRHMKLTTTQKEIFKANWIMQRG